MEHIKELQKERVRMEKRLEELTKYLNSPGIKDFKEVDEEGYPNPDSEMIISLRKIKHEFNCLETDYKNLMNDLTQSLYQIHEEALRYEQNNQQGEKITYDVQPLAIIKKIDCDSPAEKAGLQEGDIIIAFGGYKLKSGDMPLQKIAEITNQYSGTNGIEIDVTRKGEILRTKLYPDQYNEHTHCGFFIIPY
ncbi:proteasome regulatory subunit, putative [Entamoeba histolytica HM-1:IMSS-B]|uniref:Proteasome regulatory subunit, putative n=6 Tax=Entamoeba histolytica TaxID=5759 RepID=C4M9F1_ENTH1|nr:proteasome regulatory subunit, putative [Entamoeba histolytica HM-1:IMSS]EMD48454.1 proteasome regulatory subunit, putative [Entamoeba histolytica KU27]EMH77897.1 proteasome regulatory subunit, putative [Entamoeba histolytica HM-1:IMSS-B]EMS14120.1 proteasome regulatory subunit [Entamoeba histolytica HM-3:IMSS]ENY61631.1 proteasome regulatory subunit, putative [Entamoeba histolytica HM-1:IMSS-A]GAT98291.1 proteasome regulatory subunit putative [Entamoeba histolytica]|eukprot:XP_649580.1 proteasome regulatory subunit, putative [Entamoeba histolytica HM-1:IMSS]